VSETSAWWHLEPSLNVSETLVFDTFKLGSRCHHALVSDTF
jgi:hypothetical protein